MITGKKLIELGLKPSKWFKHIIEYANEHQLDAKEILAYAHQIIPKQLVPFQQPIPYHKNIKASSEDEKIISSLL